MPDDEYVRPFGDFVAALADLDGHLADDARTHAMLVTEMRLDLACELDVAVDDDGGVRLAGGPPTQHVETTTMPVFHQIRIRVMPDGDD